MLTKETTDFTGRRRGRSYRLLWALLVVTLFAIFTVKANALTITGRVDAKYLVSGSNISSKGPALLKMSFENNTRGTNLTLCAGTPADFNAGKCGMLLASSGGPGFRFLVLIDASDLNGKPIYVLRVVGSEVSQFTLVVE